MRSNLLSYLIGEKEITSIRQAHDKLMKLVKTTFFSKTTNYAELISYQYLCRFSQSHLQQSLAYRLKNDNNKQNHFESLIFLNYYLPKLDFLNLLA
jgi:hypothetical protein